MDLVRRKAEIVVLELTLCLADLIGRTFHVVIRFDENPDLLFSDYLVRRCASSKTNMIARVLRVYGRDLTVSVLSPHIPSDYIEKTPETSLMAGTSSIINIQSFWSHFWQYTISQYTISTYNY